MQTGLGSPSGVPPSKQSFWQGFNKRPNTPLGRWSVALGAAFVILMSINITIFRRLPEDVAWRVTVLPFFAISMLLCGLAAGSIGLIAVTRQRERSWLVWLAILPGLFVLVFMLGEFLVPH